MFGARVRAKYSVDLWSYGFRAAYSFVSYGGVLKRLLGEYSAR